MSVIQTALGQHKNFTPYSKEYIDEVSKRQNARGFNRDILDSNVFGSGQNLKRGDITDTNDYIYDGQNWLKIGTKAATSLLDSIKNQNINDQNEVPETKEIPAPETPKPETPKKNNTNRTTTSSNRRSWGPNNTYTAPDGKTYTGMTQEQFNQRLQDYEMEDAALKQRQDRFQQLRNQTVGDNGTTKDQIFRDALNKFTADPSSFNDQQKELLYRTGEQLGYFNDTMLDNGVQKPAQNAASINPQNTNATVADQGTTTTTVAKADTKDNKSFGFYL